MSLRKVVLFALLVIVGAKFTWDFLFSERFQVYGDRYQQKWTCHVNIVLAGLDEVMSKYQDAISLYDRTMTRCPDSPVAATALYQKAVCLESCHQPLAALSVYQEYVELYPNGEKVKRSQQTMDRIRFSR